MGLRNEVIAFQVVLEGGRNASSARLDLPAIGQIANGETSDDPDSYFVGRHIELFEQHYLEVSERSRTLGWAPGSDAEPGGWLGPIPDALIPLRGAAAPTARGVSGVIDVPAERNQGVWVDIYIPVMPEADCIAADSRFRSMAMSAAPRLQRRARARSAGGNAAGGADRQDDALLLWRLPRSQSDGRPLLR